jgi:hypothetical protein
MEWHDQVAAILAAGEADVANHADQPAAGHEDAEALAPDSLNISEELLVVCHVPELAFGLIIALEIPVGWRRDYKMDRLVWNVLHLAGVTEDKTMECLRGRFSTHPSLHWLASRLREVRVTFPH